MYMYVHFTEIADNNKWLELFTSLYCGQFTVTAMNNSTTIFAYRQPNKMAVASDINCDNNVSYKTHV